MHFIGSGHIPLEHTEMLQLLSLQPGLQLELLGLWLGLARLARAGQGWQRPTFNEN